MGKSALQKSALIFFALMLWCACARATTTVTQIVDTGGTAGVNCDYTSLLSWEAQNRNLSQEDVMMVVKCRATTGVADGRVDISGWTVDNTRYIKIMADTGNEASTQWSTSKYRISSGSYQSVIQWAVSGARLELVGIQIENTGAQSPIGITIYANNGFLKATNCYFKYSGTGALYGPAMGVSAGSYSNVTLVNCIFDGWIGGTGANRATGYGLGGSYYASVGAYNCTFVNNTVARSGAYWAYGTKKMRNCIFKNNSYDLSPSGVSLTNSSYHVTDKASSAGDLGTNVTYDTTIAFAASGNYALSSTDTAAINTGTDASSENGGISTDMDGQARSGTWDMGVDEYVSSTKYKVSFE